MNEHRRDLTFAQAEGATPLPSQLELRTISPELSALLWAMVHTSLDHAVVHPGIYGGHSYLDAPWKAILQRWWVISEYRNIDEFPSATTIHGIVKNKVTSRNYVDVFDFIQFVIRQRECPRDFQTAISSVLEECRAPYRVIDRTIIPIASDEEGEAVASAMEAATNSNLAGLRTHLRSAGEELSHGNWAASVRESIHAVESAAKVLDQNSTTLGPALTTLRTTVGLNPAMERAFKALYGYSSDEKGIRHALLFEGQPNVTERDAMFMIGACASFVTYLINADR